MSVHISSARSAKETISAQCLDFLSLTLNAEQKSLPRQQVGSRKGKRWETGIKETSIETEDKGCRRGKGSED